MLVREAVAEDAAAIARLVAQLGYSAAANEILFRLETSPETDSVLVAEVRGVVVGWIHVARQHALQDEPGADIRGLVVDETHRGRGVGRALLDACDDWARRHDISVVRVRSRNTRDGAHAFYASAGYEEIKTSLVFVKRLD